MRRRQFLGSISVVAGVAGFVAAPRDPDPNEGDASGRFLAGVRRSAYPKPLTIGAGPDETASASAGYDAGSGGTETIHFTYPGGSEEYDVPVRTDGSTGTPRSGTGR